MNSITLIGRAGRDPEVRYFEDGKMVANFTLAVNTYKRDDEPDWFTLEIWGKQAQVAADYVRKGSQIAVIGSAQLETWTDRSTELSTARSGSALTAWNCSAASATAAPPQPAARPWQASHQCGTAAHRREAMASRSKPVAVHPPAWSAAEIGQLEALAGDQPFPELFKSYNRWAVRQRPPLPRRTKDAIWQQASKRRISLRCYGKQLTIADVAAILGISKHRVRRWITLGLVPAKRYYWVYLNRKDLVAMAKAHPQELHSISRERLYQLLESEDLADCTVTKAKDTRNPHGPRPVRCVETGFQWPSISAASRAVYCNSGSISKAVRHGWAVANRHWEFVA